MYEKKKEKEEKKADIVICTDFGKLSEGIWFAYLSMNVNMEKKLFEFNDDECWCWFTVCSYGNVSCVRVK